MCGLVELFDDPGFLRRAVDFEAPPAVHALLALIADIAEPIDVGVVFHGLPAFWASNN